MRFRFGTGALLVSIVVAGLLFVFVRSQVQRRSLQATAVRQFESCGGTLTDFVYRIDSMGRLSPDYSGRPAAPFLDHFFGDSVASSILEIDLRRGEEAQKALQYLPSFAQAKRIRINSPALRDPDLLSCSHFAQVEWLNIADTEVSNAGLRAVIGWRQLRQLDLCGTKITDEGLQHLSGLESLQTLSLRSTQIDGSGLENIRHLQLKWLDVSETRVGDDDIARLSAFRSLERLDIDGTHISDKARIQLRRGLPHTDIWDG